MKNLRKIVTLGLIAVMLLVPMLVFAEKFNDVADHWSLNFVNFAAEKGFMAGYPDGSFKPEGLITHAEFASMINRAAKLEGTAEVKYTDVKADEWYYKDVQIGIAVGYLSNEGEFRPNEPISRAEVARIIGIIYKISGDLKSLQNFTDADKISEPDKAYVAALVEMKVLSGYPDSTFKPENGIKRGEAATILYKMFAENASVFDLGSVKKPEETKKPEEKKDAQAPKKETTDKLVKDPNWNGPVFPVYPINPVPTPNPTPTPTPEPTPNPTPDPEMVYGIDKLILQGSRDGNDVKYAFLLEAQSVSYSRGAKDGEQVTHYVVKYKEGTSAKTEIGKESAEKTSSKEKSDIQEILLYNGDKVLATIPGDKIKNLEVKEPLPIKVVVKKIKLKGQMIPLINMMGYTFNLNSDDISVENGKLDIRYFSVEYKYYDDLDNRENFSREKTDIAALGQFTEQGPNTEDKDTIISIMLYNESKELVYTFEVQNSDIQIEVVK